MATQVNGPKSNHTTPSTSPTINAPGHILAVAMGKGAVERGGHGGPRGLFGGMGGSFEVFAEEEEVKEDRTSEEKMTGNATYEDSGDELEEYVDDKWDDDESWVGKERKNIEEMLWNALCADIVQIPPKLSVAEEEIFHQNGDRHEGMEAVHRQCQCDYKMRH